MTAHKFNVPTDFIPYAKVVFCSNTLLNVEFLINDKNFFPLLIGRGAIPKVWIYAKDKNNKPIELVSKSISKFPLISVNIDNDNKIISIVTNEKTKKIIVLEVDYTSDDSIVVEKINLQPIGYNVIGDKNSLHIGNSNISQNTLKNVESFIGLG